jgi:glycine/D-amino acid oxidase-like deaminating enzyme
MVREPRVVVIGGGIIGLSTAMALTQHFPRERLVVVEKEPEVARHQTGAMRGTRSPSRDFCAWRHATEERAPARCTARSTY